MSTHEITAADCSWPEFHFDSPKDAFKFAAQLEKELDKPFLPEERRRKLEEMLDDLLATLFDHNI